MDNSKVVVGAVFLAAGTGLLVWGDQRYNELGNQLSRALGGATSNEAMLALGGGALCVLVGIVLLLRR